MTVAEAATLIAAVSAAVASLAASAIAIYNAVHVARLHTLVNGMSKRRSRSREISATPKAGQGSAPTQDAVGDPNGPHEHQEHRYIQLLPHDRLPGA